MTRSAHTALQDQRREAPAGQLQRGRKPGSARADDQDLDAFFFVADHESPLRR
jgi:hypothetical protein